jgi:hypothetical protein
VPATLPATSPMQPVPVVPVPPRDSDRPSRTGRRIVRRLVCLAGFGVGCWLLGALTSAASAHDVTQHRPPSPVRHVVAGPLAARQSLGARTVVAAAAPVRAPRLIRPSSAVEALRVVHPVTTTAPRLALRRAGHVAQRVVGALGRVRSTSLPVPPASVAPPTASTVGPAHPASHSARRTGARRSVSVAVRPGSAGRPARALVSGYAVRTDRAAAHHPAPVAHASTVQEATAQAPAAPVPTRTPAWQPDPAGAPGASSSAAGTASAGDAAGVALVHDLTSRAVAAVDQHAQRVPATGPDVSPD